MRHALIAATFAALFASAARADDEAANAVYERLRQSTTAADPVPLLEQVYAQGSTYLPSHAEAGIEGRDAVMQVMVGSQKHLRANGGSIALDFRVVERKRFDDVYVDNGYLRTTVKPSKDVAPQVTYAKFATVLARQPEGHWAFVTDAESQASAASFDQAKAVDGLKFDR